VVTTRESIRRERTFSGLQGERAPDYVVVGHICADLLPDGTAVLGGTALYSALAAAALGWRVGVLTRGAYGKTLDGIEIPSLDPYAGKLSLIVQDAERPTVFVNEYRAGRREQTVPHWAGEIDLRGLPPHWRNAKRADLAQAQGSDRVGEAGSVDGGNGAIGRFDEKGRGEDVAGAGEVFGVDFETRQFGVATGVDDARPIFAPRDHGQAPRADVIDGIA